MNGIEKDTFEKYPVESKLDTLFDYIKDIQERLQRIENRRWFHPVTSFLGGMVGGFGAVLSWLKIVGGGSG